MLMVDGELNDPHHVEDDGLGHLDVAGALAMRTVGVEASHDRGPLALTGHLDQPEGAHPQNAGPLFVFLECVAKGVLDLPLVAVVAQVDEVADDQPAEVAKTEAPRRSSSEERLLAGGEVLESGGFGQAKGDGIGVGDLVAGPPDP